MKVIKKLQWLVLIKKENNFKKLQFGIKAFKTSTCLNYLVLKNRTVNF